MFTYFSCHFHHITSPSYVFFWVFTMCDVTEPYMQKMNIFVAGDGSSCDRERKIGDSLTKIPFLIVERES